MNYRRNRLLCLCLVWHTDQLTETTKSYLQFVIDGQKQKKNKKQK